MAQPAGAHGATALGARRGMCVGRVRGRVRAPGLHEPPSYQARVGSKAVDVAPDRAGVHSKCAPAVQDDVLRGHPNKHVGSGQACVRGNPAVVPHDAAEAPIALRGATKAPQPQPRQDSRRAGRRRVSTSPTVLSVLLMCSSTRPPLWAGSCAKVSADSRSYCTAPPGVPPAASAAEATFGAETAGRFVASAGCG